MPKRYLRRPDGTLVEYSGGSGGDISREEFNQLSEAIDDLKQNGTGGSGITSDVKTALLNAFAHVAWTDENGQSYYDALATALNASGGDSGGGDEGGEGETPVVTLTSISAVYGGGEVASGTALTDLTDIVVTAHYSDGTTKTITNYTLSGEIVAGANTITVSYGGMTTTFEVVGTESVRTYLDFDSFLRIGNVNTWTGTAYSDDGETTTTLGTGMGYVINRAFDEDIDIHFKLTWGATTIWRNLILASMVPGTLDANNIHQGVDTMYRVTSMKNYYVEGEGTDYCYAGNVYEGTYTLKAGCVLLLGNTNNTDAGQIDAENTYFYVEG